MEKSSGMGKPVVQENPESPFPVRFRRWGLGRQQEQPWFSEGIPLCSVLTLASIPSLLLVSNSSLNKEAEHDARGS